MPERATAVIVVGTRVLLMRRKKHGEEYFSFPGGTIEQGESPEQAVVRELKEEFTIDITINRFLFDSVAMGKKSYYFLVILFTGTPVLGGEEKDIMAKDPENQFAPEWRSVAELRTLENLYPQEARERIADILDTLPGRGV